MCSKFLHLYRQTEATRVSVGLPFIFVCLRSFLFPSLFLCKYISKGEKKKKNLYLEFNGRREVFDLDRILALMLITFFDLCFTCRFSLTVQLCTTFTGIYEQSHEITDDDAEGDGSRCLKLCF